MTGLEVKSFAEELQSQRWLEAERRMGAQAGLVLDFDVGAELAESVLTTPHFNRPNQRSADA